MRALVLGATGFLGLNIIDALGEADVDVRAAYRRPSLALRRRGVPRVQLDLDDPESMRLAMSGLDVVVHAAGHYPRHSQNPELALETGLRQSQAVLDAAADAGVRTLIYLSSTATVAPAKGRASDERDVFTEVPPHGLYHELKWRMEQLFLEETRFRVVVLCPAACLGPWDLRVGTSALLVATARGMQPAHPDGWVNLVDARDVARAVVAAIRVPDPPSRVLLSGSTWRLHALLGHISERYRVCPPSPALGPEEAVLRADEAERQAIVDGGRAPLVREIVDLIVHAQPIQCHLAERALGLQWTPLSDTLDAFDSFARRMRIIPQLPEQTPTKEMPHV